MSLANACAAAHARLRRRLPRAVVASLVLLAGTASLSAIPANAAVSSTTVSSCDESALRAAVAAAAPGDTIDFACGGTITLTPAGGGAVGLDKNLTIDGSGRAVTISGGGSVGALEIGAGAAVVLKGLTIADGASGTGAYGGVLNDGTLTVDGVTFSANTAGTDGAGGILNHGTLTVADSTFSGNHGGAAGAIYDAVTATLHITGSTFDANAAGGDLSAGGIYSAGGHVTVTGSTFSGNGGVQTGGVAANGGSLSVTNSTFSGNRAGWNVSSGSGGAVFGTGLATVAVTNSTLVGNTVAGAADTLSADGGIYVDPGNAVPVSLTNTVLSGNTLLLPLGVTVPANCGPIATADRGGNFSDDGSCAAGVTQTTAAALQLGPLADNGGPSRTIALGAGSVAIDAASCLQLTDQRGLPRPGAGGTACDSGAYEAQGVTDTDLALANVPADMVVDATSSAGATATYTAPTAVDEAGDASPATVSCTPESGSTFPVGTTTVTCTATDTDDTPSSASATFTVTVKQARVWSLSAVSGSGAYGGTATLTATLTYGGVAFADEPVGFALDGGTPVLTVTDGNGVATVSGVDLAGVDAGSYPGAVAAYSDRVGYLVTGTLAVSRADQTITVVTAAPSSAGDGSSFTVAATASSGLPVAYATSGSCTNSGATVTMASGSGTCTITYAQAGDGNYRPAAEVTETVDAVAVDRLPPTDAPVVSGPAGNDGWYLGDVSVAWHWTDGGSGVDTSHCTQTGVSSGEGTTVVVSSSCRDGAGNTASDSLSFKIDGTPPVITAAATGTPNANGWYTGDVVVHFTCTDAGSGVPAGACPADQTLGGEGTTVSSVAETVTDAAGNTSAASNVVAVKIDRTPPVITVPPNLRVDATGPGGTSVPYTVTAKDTLDASPTLDCTPAPNTVFAIGTTTVGCTATDAAGNTARAQFTVDVSGAAEQLAGLLAQVTGVGPGRSLADKVTEIQGDVAASDLTGACSGLDELVDLVEAQTGKKLTASQAASFVARARSIEATLGC